MQSTTKLIKHNKALLIIWTTGRTFDLSLITELSGVKRKGPVLGELQPNKDILEEPFLNNPFYRQTELYSAQSSLLWFI